MLAIYSESRIMNYHFLNLSCRLRRTKWWASKGSFFRRPNFSKWKFQKFSFIPSKNRVLPWKTSLTIKQYSIFWEAWLFQRKWKFICHLSRFKFKFLSSRQNLGRKGRNTRVKKNLLYHIFYIHSLNESEVRCHYGEKPWEIKKILFYKQSSVERDKFNIRILHKIK